MQKCRLLDPDSQQQDYSTFYQYSGSFNFLFDSRRFVMCQDEIIHTRFSPRHIN